jgi:hypothetical protein
MSDPTALPPVASLPPAVELLQRVGRLEQVGGVEAVELADGPGRGSRLLQVETGGLRFEILADRGFDIGRAWWRGRPLAWWSAVGHRSPALVDTSGIEWFRGWGGGLLTTCGLDHTLLGGEDDASHFNYPHRRVEHYGLHGRYTAQPARVIGSGEEWHGDSCVLWAEAEVRQVAVFGEQLSLRRRIEAELGGRTIRIQDIVRNLGATPVTHMQLYHCNIGWPIVDEGAELLYPAPAGTVVSEASTAEYRRLTGPDPAWVEECYEHDMRPGADGRVHAAIVNRAAGLGIVQTYRAEQLPHHITWRQLGVGSYAVAMEPSTNRDAGRFDARERGELILLGPGEERRYDLELTVLDGVAEIEAFAERAA